MRARGIVELAINARSAGLAALVVLVVIAGLASTVRGEGADSGANASSLLIAGGSLVAPDTGGLIATLLPGGQRVGGLLEGGPTQGDALTPGPDGQHAYLVDRAWLADEQRAEWRLNELELPSLRVVRRTLFADGINLLGRARIVAAAPDGREVYVETWRETGPARFDPQLGVGQPDGMYGVAVYDVAQSAFVRTIELAVPWCGVAELHAMANGLLAVVCPLGHEVRLINPRLGQTVGSVGVSGEEAELSPDREHLWVVSRSGQVQEVDLSRLTVTRSTQAVDVCDSCVPFQRLHSSADGTRLFIRAAPDQPQLTSSGHGAVVWVVDTVTLQRVAQVQLPAPAFDFAPTPDGRAIVISNPNTQDPSQKATWLIDVSTSRELAHWPVAICCLEVWPITPASRT